jgi:hypothetical protein
MAQFDSDPSPPPGDLSVNGPLHSGLVSSMQTTSFLIASRANLLNIAYGLQSNRCWSIPPVGVAEEH